MMAARSASTRGGRIALGEAPRLTAPMPSRAIAATASINNGVIMALVAVTPAPVTCQVRISGSKYTVAPGAPAQARHIHAVVTGAST